MKKYIAAAMLTTAVVLAGCGTQSSSNKEVGSTEMPGTKATEPTYKSPSTTVPKQDPIMSSYLRTMKDRFPWKTDSELIALGKQACDVIDVAGSITVAMLAIASDPTWSVEAAGDAAYTFGASVIAFCPEYTPELMRLAQ